MGGREGPGRRAPGRGRGARAPATPVAAAAAGGSRGAGHAAAGPAARSERPALSEVRAGRVLGGWGRPGRRLRVGLGLRRARAAPGRGPRGPNARVRSLRGMQAPLGLEDPGRQGPRVPERGN